MTNSFSKLLVPAVLAAAAACSSSSAPTPERTTAAPPTIHTVGAGPGGILVNGYLVEGATGVVAVDSALTVSDAGALRARLDAIGKPLLAVLITHGHPDHYNGVTQLVAGARAPVPVLATREVAAVIRESDAGKEAQWKPMFGDEWPARRTFPDREMKDGETVVLDDLRWTVHAVGPGESHADSYWVLDTGGGHAFIGDVVLHGVHAYTSDGHTTAWLANLARLGRELDGVAVLHPGHGASGGLELLEWQRRYLEAYRVEVEALRKGGAQLGEADEQALVAAMKRHYPDAGLEMLIGLGADAVAGELDAAEGGSP